MESVILSPNLMLGIIWLKSLNLIMISWRYNCLTMGREWLHLRLAAKFSMVLVMKVRFEEAYSKTFSILILLLSYNEES